MSDYKDNSKHKTKPVPQNEEYFRMSKKRKRALGLDNFANSEELDSSVQQTTSTDEIPPSNNDSNENNSTNPAPTISDGLVYKFSKIPLFTDFFTMQDLNSAIRVFETFSEHPGMKIEARRTPEIARLFKLAREVVTNRKDRATMIVSDDEGSNTTTTTKDKTFTLRLPDVTSGVGDDDVANTTKMMEQTSSSWYSDEPDVKGDEVNMEEEASKPAVVGVSLKNLLKRHKIEKLNVRDSKLLDTCKLRKARKIAKANYSGGYLGNVMSVPRCLLQPGPVADAARVEHLYPTETMQDLALVEHMELESTDSLFTNSLLSLTTTSPQQLQIAKILHKPRKCYICKKEYNELHDFYCSLCKKCGDFNFRKRDQTANLANRICIVTGARLKIGFCISAQLLRSNAEKVIVTTRFPIDCARRYSKLPDFESFRGRLCIYAVEFRSLAMVAAFAGEVKKRLGRLDVLINNAAQTVRRPPKFYQGVLGEECITRENHNEVKNWLDIMVPEFDADTKSWMFGGNTDMDMSAADSLSSFDATLVAVQQHHHSPSTLVYQPAASAMMTQIPVLAGDADQDRCKSISTDINENKDLFPVGQTDPSDGQQIDLRPQNSWTLKLGEIELPEVLETHYVNIFAPWVLISEFLDVIENTKTLGGVTVDNLDKYIVNVSVMEGQFHRVWKSSNHVHTNMAKAALNMMTRTSASDLASRNIYMTAVDTGWVTNEVPNPDNVQASSDQKRKLPPIDEVDGAARVLDPVFVGIKGGQKMWGVFLKDYKVTVW
ncbi:hypothetical protein HK098_004439 [Nowakowskiella sp. JEL0407]|nr:hypothetical protein HK098_004439 [Nowakowskiella sp. JEL0407]